MKVATASEAMDMGTRLAGRPIRAAELVRRGGNNLIFHLSADDCEMALKIYPRQNEDQRDRFGREYGVLSFLTANGVTDVPRPLAADPAIPCALYEWIDGSAVTQASETEIDGMADFLLRLKDLAALPEALAINPASAAIFAPAEAVAQAEMRLAQLRAATSQSDLMAFLDHELEPAITRAATDLIGDDCPLADNLRILSPSDFGLHNALRRPDGRLVFLDFEYFGWDDPVKAAIDVSLHAGMDLTPALGARFIQRMQDGLITTDPGFSHRLGRLYPLILTIWCLILLNEFRPQIRARREAAGLSTDPARQLARARALLNRLER